MSNKEDPSRSPLLELPPELRNLIYREILADPDDDCFYIREKAGVGRLLRPGSQERYKLPVWSMPSFLQTCTQIRDEALGIYFSENTFIVSSNSQAYSCVAKFLHGKRVLIKWMVALGPRICGMLRTIECVGVPGNHVDELMEEVEEIFEEERLEEGDEDLEDNMDEGDADGNEFDGKEFDEDALHEDALDEDEFEDRSEDENFEEESLEDQV